MYSRDKYKEYLWDVTPYSPVGIYGLLEQRVRVVVKIEAKRFSEELANFYQNTWRYIEAHSTLQLKSIFTPKLGGLA
jgi:hypothetical protein